MDIGAALVAHLEAAETVEPRERAFHYPAIPPEPLARFDPAPRNPWNDAPRPQRPSAAWVVIALIGVQLHWTLARPSPALVWQPQGWDRIDGLLQQPRVVYVRPRHGHRKWQAVAVYYNVALGPQLAAIRRILAGRFAPPGAGTLALSSDARVQSMRSASCSRCKSA